VLDLLEQSRSAEDAAAKANFNGDSPLGPPWAWVYAWNGQRVVRWGSDLVPGTPSDGDWDEHAHVDELMDSWRAVAESRTLGQGLCRGDTAEMQHWLAWDVLAEGWAERRSDVARLEAPQLRGEVSPHARHHGSLHLGVTERRFINHSYVRCWLFYFLLVMSFYSPCVLRPSGASSHITSFASSPSTQLFSRSPLHGLLLFVPHRYLPVFCCTNGAQLQFWPQ
jgi:hypothetical protein